MLRITPICRTTDHQALPWLGLQLPLSLPVLLLAPLHPSHADLLGFLERPTPISPRSLQATVPTPGLLLLVLLAHITVNSVVKSPTPSPLSAMVFSYFYNGTIISCNYLTYLLTCFYVIPPIDFTRRLQSVTSAFTVPGPQCTDGAPTGHR